jgi:hypothetical protein
MTLRFKFENGYQLNVGVGPGSASIVVRKVVKLYSKATADFLLGKVKFEGNEIKSKCVKKGLSKSRWKGTLYRIKEKALHYCKAFECSSHPRMT